MERETLKLALEVLEDLPGFRADIDNAIAAIKEVLAQPALEPVAWAGVDFDINTTPPQRPWVGLTDEEIQPRLNGLPTQSIAVYARNIEAILKDKNNG